MANEAEKAVNSIVAEALKNVGVAPRDINIPPEPVPVSEPPDKVSPKTTKLDGSLKGQVRGEIPEEKATPPEAEPTETPGAKAGESESKPLAKADIEALINQASSKFQSIVDKRINSLNTQMQQTVAALNEFLQSQEDAGLAGLPPEEQLARRVTRLEKGGQQPKIQVQQPVEQQSVQFVQYLANFVDAVGLKIDDPRIDWAPDVADPQTGLNRFTASVKKALVEDQTKILEELKNNGDRVLQSVRKKAGVDKVSTSGPGGAGLPDLSKMTPFEKLTYAFSEAEAINQNQT